MLEFTDQNRSKLDMSNAFEAKPMSLPYIYSTVLEHSMQS